MSRSTMFLAFVGIAGTLAACAAEEGPKPGLIGTWTKQHTQEEGHAYPGDTNWDLEVTFRPNGQFVWRSTRTDGTNRIDESLTGTYSLERGMMIIYRFDKPSNAADKRLAEWFAYWPSKLEGQHTFRFRKDFLILGHDGNKLWFYMKRKNV